jgi:hypothetical protein
MEQKKVRLPREVAEALEESKKLFPDDIELVAWSIPDENMAAIHGDHWKVLYDYADENNNGFFQLTDALRYGYVIDEPIRVEITTEMQEMIQQYIGSIRQDRENVDFAQGEEMGLMTALSIFNIKIPGVNE